MDHQLAVSLREVVLRVFIVVSVVSLRVVLRVFTDRVFTGLLPLLLIA